MVYSSAESGIFAYSGDAARFLSVYEVLSVCDCRGFGAGRGAKLGEDGRDRVFYSVLRYGEFFRDVGVGAANRD